MTPATLADWTTTPRPFALPDLGPGLEGARRQALEAERISARKKLSCPEKPDHLKERDE